MINVGRLGRSRVASAGGRWQVKCGPSFSSTGHPPLALATRNSLLMLLLALVILPVGKSSGQKTTAQAPLPALPAELGAPPERIPQAPGRFYELPPRWGRETVGHSRPNIAGLISGGYITPAEVAENYHYEQPYRPQFHFTALHGHIGDATGLFTYKGRYHLFFMFDPWQRSRGWHKAWGHAVSNDLLHWEQRPPVTDTLVDGRSGSGSGVVDWNNSSGLRTGPERPLLIFYSDYWRGTCIKYSNDGGDTWKHYIHNPVLPGYDDIRDPLVFWYEPDQSWRMVRYERLGFTFYASQNLIDWRYLSRIADQRLRECPDMFKLPVLGGKEQMRWVVVNGNGTYMVGDFDGKQFIPEGGLRRAHHGRNFYATQTWKQTRSGADPVIQTAVMGYNRSVLRTWEGQMAFPCELTLHDSADGIRMRRQPIAAIESLHKKTRRWVSETVDSAELALGEGSALDIRLIVEPKTADSFGIIARGQEITYSVPDKAVRCLGASAPLAPIDGRIQLQILVDRASIEVFGNDGRISISSLFFPDREDQKLQFFSRGGAANIVELEVHWVESIWQRFHAQQHRPVLFESPQTAPLGERYARGRSVFNFDDPQVRSAWRLVEGDVPEVFTTSTRRDFGAPYRRFIGTGEFEAGDESTAVIESPEFKIVANAYSLVLSGGYDIAKMFAAVLDAATGEELFRVSCPEGHRMVDCWLDTSDLIGRKVVVRIVDRFRGRRGHSKPEDVSGESFHRTGIPVFGHVNLGGVFEGQESRPDQREQRSAAADSGTR